MTADQIAGRVNRIIADVLGVEDARVLPGARLREGLGADSRGLDALADALACEFGGDGDLWFCRLAYCGSVGDVAAYVERISGAAFVEARVGAWVGRG